MASRSVVEARVVGYVQFLTGRVFAVDQDVAGGGSGSPVLFEGKVVGLMSRHCTRASCGRDEEGNWVTRSFAVPVSLFRSAIFWEERQ